MLGRLGLSDVLWAARGEVEPEGRVWARLNSESADLNRLRRAKASIDSSRGIGAAASMEFRRSALLPVVPADGRVPRCAPSMTMGKVCILLSQRRSVTRGDVSDNLSLCRRPTAQ